MKKYLLLYVSLFFCVSPSSWAMDYDQDEGEYDQGGGGNIGMPMQNNMQNNMMMQQPGMMSPNNMMMQQSGMMSPNNMMMQQPGMMSRNNMMMQQPGMMSRNSMRMNRNMMMNPMRNFGNREDQDDETDKKEYVQSLVNNILKVNRGRQNSALRTENGGTVIDRNLKNKLFKLQKDLEEISRSLGGIPQDDESLTERSSKKSKSSTKEESSKKSEKTKGKKSSKKSEGTKGKKSSGKSETSKGSRSSRKAKSSKFRVNSRSKNWNRKYKFGRVKRFSKFSRPRGFYTVKQLTPRNAVKYVPRTFSYEYDKSGGYSRTDPTPIKEMTYKVKNWGTGEITSASDYYLHNSQNSQNSYFSDKSKCSNGCGTQ